MSPVETGSNTSKVLMKKQLRDEKISLISKLMDSYILTKEALSDQWLVETFDKLYDMDIEALKYLSDLRKIKKKQEFVEY